MVFKLNRKFNVMGFSFLELLIVLVIIGIVAAIATPQLEHYKQLKYDRESKDNLDKLYQACEKFWGNNINTECSIDIAKETSNGYTQSSNIIIVIPNGKETKTDFQATAKHSSSNKTYTMDEKGNIR
jgi:prepilin-type N-terminal cleavage/methylation domain-containing protein